MSESLQHYDSKYILADGIEGYFEKLGLSVDIIVDKKTDDCKCGKIPDILIKHNGKVVAIEYQLSKIAKRKSIGVKYNLYHKEGIKCIYIFRKGYRKYNYKVDFILLNDDGSIYNYNIVELYKLRRCCIESTDMILKSMFNDVGDFIRYFFYDNYERLCIRQKLYQLDEVYKYEQISKLLPSISKEKACDDLKRFMKQYNIK